MRRELVLYFAMAILFARESIGQPAPARVELSGEEQIFISRHRPIRVGITPEWAPFSYFVSAGKGAGIDVDLLNIVAKQTGLKFELLPGDPPWDEIWRMAQAGEVDLTTSTVQSPEREQVFRFTNPYAISRHVIVSRAGDLRFRHLSLLDNATIAQPRDHRVTVALVQRLPRASIMFFAAQKECFEAVALGKADVAVADLYTATQYMNDHPYVKLGISGIVPEFEFPLRFAVRRDYPILVDIINKSLATVSDEEMDAIESKHLLFTLQAGKRVALLRKRLAYVVAGALVFSGIFVVWHFLIRKEIIARRRAEADLREINRSLEIFSHAIAHDLRAPMRAVGGLSEALSQDYGEKLDEVGKDYLSRITHAARRMEVLVRDVLAYSQASRAEFKIDNVSLKQIVHELLGEFSPEQRPYFSVNSELPTVRGHPALLAQCLSNLFSNAIKFIPKDRTPEIRVWSERRDSYVRTWVEDNGIGIANDDRERIFKLFQQASHNFGGTGIGLAVVAKGVERMGGRVGVESEIGRGSRFWIELEPGT